MFDEFIGIQIGYIGVDNQIRPEANVFDRKWILNFENMAGIPSPFKKRWQAYLVRNKADMASMSSLLCHRHGRHTWYPLLLNGKHI